MSWTMNRVVAVALLAGCNLPPAPAVLEAALTTATHKAVVRKGTLTITGTREGSRLALRLQSPSILEVDVDDDGTAEFAFDRSSFDHIRVDAGEGDDVVRIDETNGVFSNEEAITVLGGSGNDTLLGGFGAEVLQGGPGDDVIDGGPGADTISMGDGSDTFNWDPGDGSDVVDGEGGSDAVVFNGSLANENIDVSANGTRLRILRDIAAVTLDAGGIERVDFNVRGGTDRVVVQDLAGTSVAQVNVDLAALPGSGTGDAQADVVIVAGTTVTVAAEGAAVVATGVGARVSVTGGEPAIDALQVNGAQLINVNGSAAADTMDVTESAGHALVAVAGWSVKVDAFAMAKLSLNGLGGDDTLRLFSAQNPLPVQLDGGDGNDHIFGGNFADLLIGGAGDDFIDGGPGADSIFLGDGNDTFNWDPGDGSDVIEGEAGSDAIVFNGGAANEQFTVSASGNRLRLFRDVASVTTDAGGIERVDLNTLAGSDRVTVNDLAGTPVARVNVNLAANGTGDGQPDVVLLAGSHLFDVAAEGAAVVATGLGASVGVTGGEPALDALEVDGADLVNVNGSAAADTIDVSESSGHALVSVAGWSVKVDAFAMARLSVNGLGGDDTLRLLSAQNPLPVQLDGGDGNDHIFGGNFADLLIGGAGDDFIDGGPGADSIFMGDGNDTFNWDPGDASDIVEGEAGSDAIVFNASAANEQMTLGASGSRLRILRDIGAVTLDAGGIERVDIAARAGTDRITVNDLSGTQVAQVNVDLAAFAGGASDAASDVVALQGSANPDLIALVADGGAVVVSGLAATVRISAADLFDQLVVSGLGGLDAFSVGPGVDALMTLTLNQD